MRRLIALTMLLALAGPAGAAAGERKPPYWASISAGQALMRTGPGRNFPGVWLYRRADLPVKVIEIYPSWRKVQDPDGTTGWMLVNLLSDTRTALVTGADPRPIRKAPEADAAILFLAQPGVVGRISKCDPNWCRIEAGGHAGYIQTDHIWGLDKGEAVP